MCEKFSIGIPEYFSSGFDVIDAWAKKDRKIKRNELRAVELKKYTGIK